MEKRTKKKNSHMDMNHERKENEEIKKCRGFVNGYRVLALPIVQMSTSTPRKYRYMYAKIHQEKKIQLTNESSDDDDDDDDDKKDDTTNRTVFVANVPRPTFCVFRDEVMIDPNSVNEIRRDLKDIFEQRK